MIQEAATNEERQEIRDFFLATFDDIDPAAVPMIGDDALYDPLIAFQRDPKTQKLVGAALTCRAQVAVGSALMRKNGMPIRPEADYDSVLDRHSELDLLSVAPEARGKGIGSQLVANLEARLRSRGVRVWFGSVTPDLKTAQLRAFYAARGFVVLENGQRLPPLLGHNWTVPTATSPAFFFYKALTRTTPAEPKV